MLNLEGQIFGYLTAVEYQKGGKWKCKCVCGKEVIHRTCKLTGTYGFTVKSCGCKKYEIRNKTNALNGFTPGKYERQAYGGEKH